MNLAPPLSSPAMLTPPEPDTPMQCEGCRTGFNMNENPPQHQDMHRGQAAQEVRRTLPIRMEYSYGNGDHHNRRSDHGIEAEKLRFPILKNSSSPSTMREKSHDGEQKNDKEDKKGGWYQHAPSTSAQNPCLIPPGWAYGGGRRGRGMPGHPGPLAYNQGHGHDDVEKENSKHGKEGGGHPDPSPPFNLLIGPPSYAEYAEYFANLARRGGQGGRGGHGMPGHHHHDQPHLGGRPIWGPGAPPPAKVAEEAARQTSNYVNPFVHGMYDLVGRNVVAATAATVGSFPGAHAAAALAGLSGAAFSPTGPIRRVGADGSVENATLPAHGTNTFRPTIDLFATEHGWTIHAELAGAKKEDMAVSWDPRKGELVLTGVVVRPGDEVFLRGLVSPERNIGMFERRVRLPPVGATNHEDEIDGDSIAARMDDGVLIVTVPRKEKEWTDVKKVDIN